MTITYLDVIRAAKSLKAIASREDIPFAAGYVLAKNIVAIDRAITDYAQKKNALDREHLTDGEPPAIKSGNEEDYLKGITELNSTKIDIVIEKIPAKALGNAHVPPILILPIMFMLE